MAEDNILLFGRKTYESMAAFWPTAMVAQQFPEVAEGMNHAEKIVFSREPFTPSWDGTRCVAGDVVAEVRGLKRAERDMTILGSGTIVNLLAGHGLVDRLQVMVDPVAIGRGTTLFHGPEGKLPLQLVEHRVFESGTVLLTYVPRE